MSNGCELMKCKYWDGKICTSEVDTCLYQTREETWEDLETTIAAQAKELEGYKKALVELSHQPCLGYDGCDDKKCVCPRGIAEQALTG